MPRFNKKENSEAYTFSLNKKQAGKRNREKRVEFEYQFQFDTGEQDTLDYVMRCNIFEEFCKVEEIC